MKRAASAPDLRAARRAVTAIFAVNGAVFANWVPRVPDIKRTLGLGEGELGLALLGLAVGALVALPPSGLLAARLGSGRAVRISLVAFAAALVLVGLASSLAQLALALAVMGAANSALDVAMNAQGVAVDRRYGRPVFASFHAAFSFGFVGGAALGSLAAAAALSPALHFAAASAVLAAVGLVATRRLLASERDASGETQAVFARPTRRLLGLGSIAVLSALAEGATADWSALYLSDVLGVGAGLAGAAFAAFSLMMGTGRALGDRLIAAWGPVAVARRGAALAAFSLAGALAAGHPLVAVLGFAGLGAGISCVFPLALSAAGRAPGVTSAAGIAAVSTTGYLGFVAGPPLIGAAAEVATLPAALCIPVAACAAIALLAGSVATPAGSTRRPVEPSRRLAVRAALR
jgi:MFS family permease